MFLEVASWFSEATSALDLIRRWNIIYPMDWQEFPEPEDAMAHMADHINDDEPHPHEGMMLDELLATLIEVYKSTVNI